MIPDRDDSLIATEAPDVGKISETRLARLKSAGHIPMENAPKAVAGALAEFAAER
jgi:hypothetical protein